MDPELFIRHIVRLVKTTPGAMVDSVSAQLNSKDTSGGSMTAEYGRSIKDESFFDAGIQASVAKTPKHKKRAPAVQVIKFNRGSRLSVLPAATSEGVGSGGGEGGEGSREGTGSAAAEAHTFTRRAAPAVMGVRRSLLTDIVAVEEMNRRRRAAGRETKIRVFFACLDGAVEPMRLSVDCGCTMDAVIARVLELYKEQERTPALPKSQSGWYQLRLTEDDEAGTPDDDLPPLERTQVLKNIGCTDFAMCYNPSGGSRSKRGSTRVQARDSVVFSVDAPIAEDQVGIRVHLPDQTTTSVIVNGNMTVADFLTKISNKRSIRLEGAQLFLPDMALPANPGQPVKDLLTEEVYIRMSAVPGNVRSGSRLSRTSSISGDVAVDYQHMFNQFTAIMYKEYSVIKINKAGKRQGRIMGIDDKRIHNKLPESEKKGGMMSRFKKKTPKRPFRNMDEVVDIEQDEDNPVAFTIRFKGDEQTAYEALSANEASEIVAKITYLLGMLRND